MRPTTSERKHKNNAQKKKMSSQQIVEFLLAMQAKADARHEEMMADWKAWQEGMTAAKMQWRQIQEKMRM
jgi:hypothetical protein